MIPNMPRGCVLADLAGTRLAPDERELLLHPQVGGVILFTRNFQSVEQLADLVSEIHGLRSPHLLEASRTSLAPQIPRALQALRSLIEVH
jgi:beta-glucosidase-like glycosyl hydrolase